jgi:3-oxoadipate enol-lactonase
VIGDAFGHARWKELSASGAKNGPTQWDTAKQILSDLSFGSTAAPALIEWARREVVQTPEFVARMAIQSLSNADTRNSLAQIKVPTLVIVGEEDRVTPPRESKLLAEGINNSTLSVIPKAGHFSMLEQPAAFNRILRSFITRGEKATRA